MTHANQDKVIIITGASSGIGESTAKLLASQGAKLALGARREDRLKQVCDAIQAEGGQAIYQVMDVTRAEDNQAIVDLAKQHFGKVDTIFLNAGVMPNSPVSALKTDEWEQMVDINIKGVLNGVAAVMPLFKEQNHGHVLSTSSVAGLKAYPACSVYCGTKWFVRSFMEILRMESAMEGSNIKTTTIYPAAIHTELTETITDSATAAGMNELYEQHGITSDRIANVVAFALAQPQDTSIAELTVGPTTQPW
ncbi:MAG: SDR family oxidoreductase [Oceanospirillaceae bacterium]|nr:SDR family oxidoreductase [Oceanospirillaceae bacterium]